MKGGESRIAVEVERPAPPIAAWVAALVTLLALVLGGFQLYTAGVQPFNLFVQRGFHLTLVLVIAFLVFPIGRRPRVLPVSHTPAIRARMDSFRPLAGR